MYIDFGHGVFLREKEVIGVFDIDKTTLSKHTKAFLKKAEQDGKIINAFDDIPNSIILTDKSLYLTHTSSQTLKRRAKSKKMGLK